jgi:hypothetical protein
MSLLEARREDFDRYQRGALLAGAVAGAVCVVGAFFDPRQFFFSYLYAFLFWLGLSLGSLALLMLHHKVVGLWGFAIQRPLEAASRLIPLLALLFVPILIGIPYLYPWSHSATRSQPAIAEKGAYLSLPFFVGRAVLYFAVWCLLAYLMSRWSTKLDETGDGRYVTRMARMSGPGLVIYGLTITFAAIDWAMSLEPEWYSTIFGLIFLTGQGVAAVSFAIIVTRFLSKGEPLSEIVSPKQFLDLGNLLLAFVMLWAYMSFSQFLIIWSGNLPEEAVWYAHRLRGGWGWVGVVLIVLHFFVPFFILLQRRSKQRAKALSIIAAGLLFFRFVDLFWVVAPALHRRSFAIHWLDFVAPIAIGGFWLSAFVWQLKARPLIPAQDPRLTEAVAYLEATT